jgi:hypothetical protein
MILIRLLFAAILVMALLSGARAQSLGWAGDPIHSGNNKLKISMVDVLREIRVARERETERRMKEFDQYLAKQAPGRRVPVQRCLESKRVPQVRTIIAEAEASDLVSRTEETVAGLDVASEEELRACLKHVFNLQYSKSLNEKISEVYRVLNRRYEREGHARPSTLPEPSWY